MSPAWSQLQGPVCSSPPVLLQHLLGLPGQHSWAQLPVPLQQLPGVQGLPAVPCLGQLWLLGTQDDLSFYSYLFLQLSPPCSRGVSETSSLLCLWQFRVPGLGEGEQGAAPSPLPCPSRELLLLLWALELPLAGAGEWGHPVHLKRSRLNPDG